MMDRSCGRGFEISLNSEIYLSNLWHVCLSLGRRSNSRGLWLEEKIFSILEGVGFIIFLLVYFFG